MTNLFTVTVAGQTDMRQRLNTDGASALGLAGPLLAPAWSQTLPTANLATLSLTMPANWFAPIAGIMTTFADGRVPGLSMLDGTPAANGGPPAVAIEIHPQARLRLERLVHAALEAAGGAAPPDRSLRPLPSKILITSPTSATWTTPQALTPGQAKVPGGTVTFHDERGLIIDPFALAAWLAALLGVQPVMGMPAIAGAAGTLAAIANLAPVGQFYHVVDMHGRPWVDPGAGNGIGLFSGPPTARVAGPRVTDHTVQPWTAGSVIAAEADPGDQQRPRQPTTIRFGFATNGLIDTTPLTWPAAGPAVPVRDTLRVVALDLPFHLTGNRTAAARDGVGGADNLTLAEQAPQVRDGSPITLLPDGHSTLAWFRAVILGLQGGAPGGAFNSGPLLVSTVAFDDEQWPLPLNPLPNGRWPIQPAAVPVAGSESQVLTQLAPIRKATAQWVQGTGNVLVSLPPGLPNGIFMRLYPIEVKMGTSIDEQPLLVRHDGNSTFLTGANDQVLLTDPFRGQGAPPAAATLRADAAVTWQPAGGGPITTHFISNLALPVNGTVPAPAPAGLNFLGANFWKSICSSPMLGVPPTGNFSIGALLGDPVAFMTDLVNQLTSNANPREAPRLPTMSRTESLMALQDLNNALDPFRGVLTGGWLTRESDTYSYRNANPGGAGNSEVHAPGVAAISQLGFDLWVAAMHRARPVVPTADMAGIPSLPALPNNWVLLQTSANTSPPNPPAVPATTAGALLQTVPPYVETPEMALIPANDINTVTNWITSQLSTYVSSPNDPELHRQMVREVRSSKYGRRDTQWALRRAIRHARELIYIETPLLGNTATAVGAPADPNAAVDLITELTNAMQAEPGLRVVILLPREIPLALVPWQMYFFGARQVLTGIQQNLNPIYGRQRLVVAHPIGAPGRSLHLRTTTVIVDDVFCLTGTSTLTRRGLTFDGASDVVMTDRQIDRGASVAIRNHRKALMAQHLGPSQPGTGLVAPDAALVATHLPASAHEAFADLLAAGGGGKLLPLWTGPNPSAPGAPLPLPANIADPDGSGGATLMLAIAAALGNGQA